MFHKILFF